MYCTVESYGGESGKEESPLLHEVEKPIRESGENVVLVANAPLSYREAIASVLQELCSACKVLVTEPETLDLEVDRVAPKVVICSRATPLVREKAFAWVELYPDEERLAVVSIGGRSSRIPEIQLDALLSFVDRGVNPVRA